MIGVLAMKESHGKTHQHLNLWWDMWVTYQLKKTRMTHMGIFSTRELA